MGIGKAPAPRDGRWLDVRGDALFAPLGRSKNRRRLLGPPQFPPPAPPFTNPNLFIDRLLGTRLCWYPAVPVAYHSSLHRVCRSRLE
jgi:hypothetical protein